MLKFRKLLGCIKKWPFWTLSRFAYSIVYIYVDKFPCATIANIPDFFFRLKAARTPKRSDLEGRPPSDGNYVRQNPRHAVPRPRPKKGRRIVLGPSPKTTEPKTTEPKTTEPETTEPETTTPELPKLRDDDGKYILFS